MAATRYKLDDFQPLLYKTTDYGKTWMAIARGIPDSAFTRVVREGQPPEDVPEFSLPAGETLHLPALLADAFGLSTSEARRLIGQGGRFELWDEARWMERRDVWLKSDDSAGTLPADLDSLSL